MTDIPPDPDDGAADVTAGEFVLGLLDGDARAAALRRMLSDRAFAADVDAWRAYLGPLFDAWPGQEPPAGLWPQIEASVDSRVGSSARSRFWPIATLVAGVAAAILLVLLVARPAPPPPPAPAPARLLAAAIQPTAGKADAVVALYDPARAAVLTGASPVDDPAHSAELWVIIGKAPPRALGLLSGSASALPLAAPTRAVIAAGATLAISREPTGGSPTGQPTGPVIATGVLQPV